VQAVTRVEVHDGGLTIELRPEAMLDPAALEGRRERAIPLRIAAAVESRGAETKLVVFGGEARSSADPALIKAIARGYAWFEELATGRATTIAQIAGREGVTDRYVSSLLRLAFLPPELVQACVAADSTELSAAALIGCDVIPIFWKAFTEENRKGSRPSLPAG